MPEVRPIDPKHGATVPPLDAEPLPHSGEPLPHGGLKAQTSPSQAEPPLRTQAGLSSLLPVALGLSTCRVSTMVSHVYGISSITMTSRGSLIMVAALFVLLVFALFSRRILDERLVSRLTACCCAAQLCLACAMMVLSGADAMSFFAGQALSIANEVATLMVMFYWLRVLSRRSIPAAATIVFLATACGEALTYLLTLIANDIIVLALVCVLCVMQFECLRLQKAQAPAPRAGRMTARATTAALARILAGLALFSLFIGFICGYPDGTSISIPISLRPAYLACATLPCVLIAIVTHFLRRPRVALLSEIMVAAFGCLSILTYTAFPYELARGAIFADAATTIMVGCVRFCIVYLMKIGTKDPLNYAIAVWCLWTGFKALASIAASALYPMQIELTLYAMGLLVLLVATLIVVPNSAPVPALAASGGPQNGAAGLQDGRNGLAAHAGECPTAAIPDPPDAAPRPDSGADGPALRPASTTSASSDAQSPSETPFLSLMGLDETGGLSQSRHASMLASARRLLAIYQLSDREIEAAALYALGFTQQRVAEEMRVSRSTAHEYIKRVYAKTDFHSRQDLIDFLS